MKKSITMTAKLPGDLQAKVDALARQIKEKELGLMIIADEGAKLENEITAIIKQQNEIINNHFDNL